MKESTWDMKKTKRIKLVILAVLLICVTVILLFPRSPLFLGPKLTIDMRVKVEREEAVPYNITCTNGAGEEQKVRIVNRGDEIVLYIGAFRHDMYTISYDVDTLEGTKHFSYGIMRTNQGGPRDSFWYYMVLDKEEDAEEWGARVWLDRKNAEARAYDISLREDESAYVQYGP